MLYSLKVVVYFSALKLLKIRTLEEVLRILQEFFKNSSGVLEEFFKNFQSRERDNNQFKF